MGLRDRPRQPNVESRYWQLLASTVSRKLRRNLRPHDRNRYDADWRTPELGIVPDALVAAG